MRFGFGNNPIVSLFRIVWRFSEGNRRHVVLYVVFFILANIVALLQPLVGAHILNVIQESGVTRANLASLLFSFALLPLFDLGFWIFHGPGRVLEMRNAFLVRAAYKEYLLAGTMALPMDWHTDHHSGDTIDKIEKGSRALYQFTEHGFQVVEALVRFVGALIAMAFFQLNIIYAVLLLVVIAIRIILTFDRKLVPQYRALSRAENKIAAKVFDVLSNISTVIILRVQHLLHRNIVEAMQKPLSLSVQNNKLNEWKWFTTSMSAAFLQFVVLSGYASLAVYNHQVVLAGTIFALFSYTGRINDVFFTFAYLYEDIVKERAQVANAEEISQFFTPHSDTGEPRIHEWKECRIEKLNFSYDQGAGARLHLENVDLTFRRGEKIAVIGESGSGKTTFLKLVRALYPLSSGTVLLDGEMLAGGFESMSEDIALIPQEPEIFATTIRENVTMGVEYPEKTIERYTDLARFSGVVARLPRGLESSVVEKGVNLSGGEKQRLALARGLLASEEKSILLLDESTSSVDAPNEMAIYENIFKTYQEKTVIASIHRLHLLRLFDTIYMFHNGSIIARGNFEQLLATSPEFTKQWEKYTLSHKKWDKK